MRVDRWLKLTKKDGLNLELLKSTLEVSNPDYLSRKKMGLSTNGLRRFDPVYVEIGEELWVPRAIVHKYDGRDIEDKTVSGKDVDFKSKIELGPNENRKEDQEKWVSDLVGILQRRYGTVGQAEPGWGKTVAALEVIARLGKTTAVLVHKEFLMNQWIERIQDCYDIDESEIGFVQQDRCDYEGKKIVLIMIQSLLARDYSPDLFEYFGTVVVDEVHRMSAVEFRKVITMFPGRYRLGVTATPKRKDGLEDVFFWHIGSIGAIGSKRKIKPRVEIVKTNVNPSPRDWMNLMDFKRDVSLSKLTTYLAEHEERNQRIARLAYKALVARRKILILSGRRVQLEILHQLVKRQMLRHGKRFPMGYYVGGMTDKQRVISSTRPLILGTYQMAEEGLDIPDLDTLFLVTPKADIEQAVGRILREVDGKKEPLVVDFLDESIGVCNGLHRKRLSQYKKLGYV